MSRFWNAFNQFHPIKYATVLYYDYELDLLVPEVKNFLEIGATTSSTNFWKSIYPNAKITICDLHNPNVEGISFLQGDIKEKDFIEQIYNAGPYDIVCEDTDHSEESQIRLFKGLWPITMGLYIIEDILHMNKNRVNDLKPWIEEQGGWCLIRPEYENDPPKSCVLSKYQAFLYAMHKKPDFQLDENTRY